ncbi:hypothetical protein [Kitasatospora aureofaciens]|uniref:hypothetical protein n=1 Tax=Kitasatospora aureofaciens TaxID=1894 RepID=UPI001C46E40C|nr:hypothetical protein [Kitasatospora aureofaciens]MBV6702954.1 hypothetical protein [Kitasatospora aureofaciens]
MLARLVEIGVWGAVLTGLTVVFISSVSPVEMVVACVSALGGAFAARRMRLAAGVHVEGGRGAVRALLALPGSVVRGLAVLTVAMAPDHAGGSVRRIRLRPGAGAGWAGTLLAASPDTCVIDVPNDDEVIVHALRPNAGPVEEAVARTDGAQ